MRSQRPSAFTLIEILIVVVLLAILAAAIIPQFSDSTTDTQSSVMLHNLNELRRQIAIYQIQHVGQLPSANIAAQLTSKTNMDGTTIGSPTIGPYFRAIPANPQVADPSIQSLIKVVNSDPVANITTHGWVYNSTNGKIYSGTDYNN
jgi:prepilin-type N-terminal cleavage/methylation domain-containing protein